MKCIQFINNNNEFVLTTENGLIFANIIHPHPESIMIDNSVLVFENIKDYYKFIGDAQLFSSVDSEYNIEFILDNYLEQSDTISDYNYHFEAVEAVHKINYKGCIIYYLQRAGINNFI